MVKYIIKRLLNGLIVLLGVVTITFFITRVVPSDVAGKWAGERATEEQRKQAIAELGLDKPLVTQYVNYLKDLLSGDLGRSLRTKELITKELASYFPATMELVLVAFLFAMFVGIPMGIYSAKKNGKMLDHATRFFSIGAVSLPTFWVAMVFQLVFYRLLNWLPLGGRISISASLLYDVPNVTGMLILDCILTGSWGLLGDAFVHIIMPGFTIALYPIGLVARMTRSALLEILNEDYITAAKSYGVREGKVLWRLCAEELPGCYRNGCCVVHGIFADQYIPYGNNFQLAGVGKLRQQIGYYAGLSGNYGYCNYLCNILCNT